MTRMKIIPVYKQSFFGHINIIEDDYWGKDFGEGLDSNLPSTPPASLPAQCLALTDENIVLSTSALRH